MSDDTENTEPENAEGTAADNAEAADGAGDDWGAAMAEQETAEKADLEDLTPEVQEGTETADISQHPNIDVIMEVPVNISMEVGSTEISIRNLLKLSQGSVIELDRFAGDPLDVYVNGSLIAHGEVVVINEKFGIRLTDVLSASERMQKLGND